MKFIAVAVALLSSALVNAYTDCQLTCATTEAAIACTTTNYNDTSCLCDSTFIGDVKNCLYQAGCNTDVPTWYDTVNTLCASVTSGEASSTAASASNSSAAAATTAKASSAAAAATATTAASVTSAAAAASSTAASSDASIVLNNIGAIGAGLVGVVGGLMML